MKNMILKGNYNNGVVQKLVELKLIWLLNPNLKGMCKRKIQIWDLSPKQTTRIKVLGASFYKLRFWILQCIIFCVLGHVGLNFWFQIIFWSFNYLFINILYVTCYNYDLD